MADGNYPLLFFPDPTVADRNPLGGGGGNVHVPGSGRQRARIAPQLAVLQQAAEAKRLRLQQAAPVENPELVLVLEVAGTVQNFVKAVSKVAGLEWLLEWAEEQVEPDEDFYVEGRKDQHKPYDSRLFLLGTNHEALTQLLALWNRHQQNPGAPFARGLAPFKHVFEQLRTIRKWSVADRVDADMRRYWQNCLQGGLETIRFEIEAWFFGTQEKNEGTRTEVDALVQRLGGQILSRAIINDIAYHGFLVELPTPAIAAILRDETPGLLLSDRIMFFRPKAQSITDGVNEAQLVIQPEIAGATNKPPVVALLDGLPLTNHALLTGRLLVDDPDGWDATYEAKDRMHGTAMASLILYGEMDGAPTPSERKLYVRPVMRPDSNDNFNARRSEHTPDDQLLIDLIHRSVKRICEGEGGQGPVAPTVRIINLSMGDEARVFAREMSPWARLLDWLAIRYSVLFIVSAGNDPHPLILNAPRDSIQGMDAETRAALAFTALARESTDRRLISPAEAINVLTVGALHSDHAQVPVVPRRFDLFANGGISPLSRVGHGYRRSIKPDILMPGGRALHIERMLGDRAVTVLDVVNSGAAPGHRSAVPPLPGQPLNETAYSRGTSNAAALASRAAEQAYDVLESLRAQFANAPPPRFDAVLLKAMLVHGAHWGDLPEKLLAERPDFHAIEHGNSRRIAEKDFVTRWLGYGMVDVSRTLSCAAERATLLGVGELGGNEAVIFSAPLPPGLAGRKAWRRLTITLVWMSPINTAHQGYRRAKLWLTPPQDQLRIKRFNSAHEKAALRGTVQHERLEGDAAVAFVDGDRFVCKVNCAADAGDLIGKVKFALCVSLEVSVDSNIAVYQEVRERIAPAVGIQPAAS